MVDRLASTHGSAIWPHDGAALTCIAPRGPARGLHTHTPLTSSQHDSRFHISGISAGGSMAAQHFVAFSSLVNGAALIAGSPYGEVSRFNPSCAHSHTLALDCSRSHAHTRSHNHTCNSSDIAHSTQAVGTFPTSTTPVIMMSHRLI